ncbi:hypothetical protein PRZ48_001614 [Zasmidium cellare]|uniref:Uncharacterized protein n=1 Tax=Zasmidium cellare TaxID=395010 RepID=A0ABR0F1Q4_ZASCE|nr:hypothetical protein PRZ48_001614 [Zasmidium cellare]
MFAPPPPPTLTREEVDRRLAAQRRGRPSTTESTAQRTNSPSSCTTREQQQNATSTSRNRSLHSSPPETPPPRTPPPLAPHERGGGIDRRAIGSPRPDTSAARRTLPVFEEPRRAPAPPKRPPRPPSELFLPPPPEPPKHGRVPISRPSRVDESPPPPPIPDKSPLRQVVNVQREEKAALSPRPLFSDMSFSKPATPPPSKPIPARSISGSIISTISGARTPTKTPSKQQPSLTEATFNAALARMKARARRDSGSSTDSHSTASSSLDPGSLGRSLTAPPSLDRVSSFSSLKAAKGAVLLRGGGSARSPTKARHVRKHSGRSLDSHRMNTAAHMRAALLEAEDRKRVKRPDSISKAERPLAPPSAPTRWKKRRKGETMSMLLDAGFFPVEEIIYGKNKKPKRPPSELSFRINLPPRLSFIEKDLPTTPSSITTTPTEVYHRQTSPTTPRSGRARNRRSGGSTRRPLSQISESEVNVEGNGGGGVGLRKESEQISPTRLAAIPEDSAAGENSPPPSGVSTPVATQIHLRGGSVLTVTPPELTAWQPTIYIHGPIKLPTPQIMPRKNSVASLEPFQEAIDQVYQHALAIPRRRSDDMVTDDICEFFDEFGFEMVSFDGDRLSPVDSALDEVEEMEYETELERFSTPPNEQPVASPVEVVIAKEILETAASKPPPGPVPTVVLPVPQVIAPPVENEETLRARGIARLSRSSAGSFPANERKDSLTIGKDREGSLPLLPPPEESMLDAVLQPSHGKGASYAASVQSSRRGRDSTSYATSTHSSRFGKDSASVHSSQIGAGGQGMEWDDDVEEIDAGSAWVAPVAAPKKPGISRGLSTRKTRNPVAKMRRLVATASTIL